MADPPADLSAHQSRANLHVRGYKEDGTTATPIDTTVRNQLDRFHSVGDVIATACPGSARAPLT
jgi:phosphoketolase